MVYYESIGDVDNLTWEIVNQSIYNYYVEKDLSITSYDFECKLSERIVKCIKNPKNIELYVRCANIVGFEQSDYIKRSNFYKMYDDFTKWCKQQNYTVPEKELADYL